MFIQYVIEEEQTFSNPYFSAVLFTSGLEEFFKWLIILIVIFKHVEFDDPYDGILYGAAVSLGFATVENILYLLTFGLDEAFIRALLPVSSHALFGVVMGYYFGKAKFSKVKRKRDYLAFALFGPMFLHIIYNSILIIGDLFMFVMVPFMLFLWWFGLRKVKLAHEHLLHHLYENKKEIKRL